MKTKRILQPRAEKTYQLNITLVHVAPPISRSLLVRGDATLELLHAVIQVAMGWTNSHLHAFTIGNDRYSDPRNADPDFDETPDRDEGKTNLMEALPQEQARFVYEYDFGDSWDHLVTVEKIHSGNILAEGVARCLGGSRRCPPEDCGGVDGYADFLEAIHDPKHPEHESMLEWCGGEFDAEAFNLEKTNRYLQKLKWPRTTESQLGKILQERDEARE